MHAYLYTLPSSLAPFHSGRESSALRFILSTEHAGAGLATVSQCSGMHRQRDHRVIACVVKLDHEEPLSLINRSGHFS